MPRRLMAKSADFGSANPGSSPGGATNRKQVEIDFAPKPVKTQPGLYLALMYAMRDASKYMRQYLETGDLNAARRAAGAWMILRTLTLSNQCSRMWSAIAAGDSPISEEEQKRAKDIYLKGE